MIDIEASTTEYLYDFYADPGVFLFDVAAAFPSVAQSWIWRVLEAMGLPLALRRGVQLLYMHSSVQFLVCGQLSANSVAVCSGIKQGCPSSGSLWALRYDPVVRLLSGVMAESALAVGCFADDLPAAARRVAEALCARPRLRVNVRKTRLVYFGERALPEVTDQMAALASGERMTVARSRVYLGVPIGIDAGSAIGARWWPRSGARRATLQGWGSPSHIGFGHTGCSDSLSRAVWRSSMCQTLL